MMERMATWWLPLLLTFIELPISSPTCTETHNLVNLTFLSSHMPITASSELPTHKSYDSHISTNTPWCANETTPGEDIEFVFRQRTVITEISVTRAEIFDNSTISASSYWYSIWVNRQSAYLLDRSANAFDLLDNMSIPLWTPPSPLNVTAVSISPASVSEGARPCAKVSIKGCFLECPRVSLINADVALLKGYSNETKTVTCKSGFVFNQTNKQKSLTVRCSELGTWSSSIHNCTAVQCSNLTITNATVLPQSGSYGNSSSVTCNTGHVTSNSGGQYLTWCNETGQWNRTEACSPITCPSLSIPNTTVSTTSGVYNDNSTVACLAGHETQTKERTYKIKCNATGQWNKTDPCKPVQCTGLTVTNATSTKTSGIYTETTTITCNPGHETMNKESQYTANCNATGSWNRTDACSPVQCTGLTVINATSTKTSGIYTEITAISCNTGHETINKESRYTAQCNASGSWNKTDGCSPVQCTGLTVINATLTKTSGIYTETTTITCNTGHETIHKESQYTAHCNASSKWNRTDGCSPITCPNLSPMYSNTVNQAGVYGNTVNVTCQAGYWISPGVTHYLATCNHTGHWNLTHNCTGMPCVPLTVSNSDSTNKNKTVYEKLNVTCNTGYVMRNTCTWSSGVPKVPTCQKYFETTCNPDQSWSTIHQCEKIQCGNLSLTNSNVTDAQGVKDGVTYITCNEGYYIQETSSSSHVMTCQNDGTWSPYYTCKPKPCSSLTVTGSNGTAVAGSYGYRVQIACNQGYAIDNTCSTGGATVTGCVGKFEIKCESNQTWSGVKLCTAQPCVDLNVPNSNGTATNKMFGDTIHVTCNAGYVINGSCVASGYTSFTCQQSAAFSCLSDTTWTPKTCIVQPCADLSLSGTNTTNVKGNVNTTVTVACLPDHDLSGGGGSYPATCQPNGLWSRADTCSEIACSPISIGNSNITITTNTIQNTVITGTCNQGYVNPTGASSPAMAVQCLPTRQWNTTACVGLPCPTTLFPNAAKNTAGSYGDQASVKCRDGFKILDGRPTYTAICLINGTWSTDGKCEASCYDIASGQLDLTECDINVLQPLKYLHYDLPVLASSSSRGYGPYRSHIDKSSPWWCADPSAASPHYIEFNFMTRTIFAKVQVTGASIVNETVTPKAVNFSVFYNGYQYGDITNREMKFMSLAENITGGEWTTNRPQTGKIIRIQIHPENGDTPCAKVQVTGCFEEHYICPERFYMYGGHCYAVGVNKTQWNPDQLMSSCRLQGPEYKPAKMDSTWEIAYLQTDYYQQSHKDCWLSLNNVKDEKVYQWMDCTTPSFTLPFKRNEPSIYTAEYDCVYSLKNGKWQDNWCNQGKRYLCEFPKGSKICNDTSYTMVRKQHSDGNTSCIVRSKNWRSYAAIRCHKDVMEGHEGGSFYQIKTSGHRAEVNSLIQNNFIWIGLTDISSEGVYKWRDGSTLTRQQENWAPGNPRQPGLKEQGISMNLDLSDERASLSKIPLCKAYYSAVAGLKHVLNAGETIQANETSSNSFLSSRDGKFSLKRYWSNRLMATHNHEYVISKYFVVYKTFERMELTTEGNFMITDNGDTVWETMTSGPGARLEFDESGSLVLNTTHGPIWYRRVSKRLGGLNYYYNKACRGILHRKNLTKIVSVTSSADGYRHDDVYRLFLDAPNERPGGWCANVNDTSPAVMFDLGVSTRVTGIAMSPQYVYVASQHKYVTDYTVSYSDDGVQWQDISENGVIKTFDGPTNGKSDVVALAGFPKPVVARHIRINITKYFSKPCMRVGLYNCPANRAALQSVAITGTTTYTEQFTDGYSTKPSGHSCLSVGKESAYKATIKLREPVYVNEIRLTTAGYSANDFSFYVYIQSEKEEFPILCTTQKSVMKPRETRSFKCQRPVFGSKVMVSSPSQNPSICEVQVFSANDTTKINKADYDSGWVELSTNTLTLNHNLGALPIYIRAFVRILSGINENYIFEATPGVFVDTADKSSGVTYYYDTSKVYFEKADSTEGTNGPVCFGHNGWLDVNKQCGAASIEVRVEAWSGCNFPAPDKVLTGTIGPSGAPLVLPYSLGALPALVFARMVATDGTPGLAFHPGGPGMTPPGTLHPSKSGFTVMLLKGHQVELHHENGVNLFATRSGIAVTRANVQVFLWKSLDGMNADYVKTFSLEGSQLPLYTDIQWYDPAESITVVRLKAAGGIYLQGSSSNYQTTVGLMYAATHDGLRFWWPTSGISSVPITYKELSITVYRTGLVSSPLSCPRTTIQNTTMRGKCGREAEIVDVYCLNNREKPVETTVCTQSSWTKTTAQCPAPDIWTSHGGYKYALTNTSGIFNTSAEYCRNNSGYVAGLFNDDIKKFIMGMMSSAGLAKVYVGLQSDFKPLAWHDGSYVHSPPGGSLPGQCLHLTVAGNMQWGTCTENLRGVCQAYSCHGASYNYKYYQIDKVGTMGTPASTNSGGEVSCAKDCGNSATCKGFMQETNTCNKYSTLPGSDVGTDVKKVFFQKQCPSEKSQGWQMVVVAKSGGGKSLEDLWLGSTPYGANNLNLTDLQDFSFSHFLSERWTGWVDISVIKYVLYKGSSELAHVIQRTAGRKKTDVLYGEGSTVMTTFSSFDGLQFYNTCQSLNWSKSVNLIDRQSGCAPADAKEADLMPSPTFWSKNASGLHKADGLIIYANKVCQIDNWLIMTSIQPLSYYKLDKSHRYLSFKVKEMKHQFTQIHFYLAENKDIWSGGRFEVRLSGGKLKSNITFWRNGQPKLLANTAPEFFQENQFVWFSWGKKTISAGLGRDTVETKMSVNLTDYVRINHVFIAAYPQLKAIVSRDATCPSLYIANTTVPYLQVFGSCKKKVQCLSGFTTATSKAPNFVDSYWTECTKDGHWTRTENCKRVPCPVTTFQFSNFINKGGEYQDTHEVKCNFGHVAKDSTNSKTSYNTSCKITGLWELAMNCTKRICNPLTITLSDRIAHKVSAYQDIINVTCNQGYRFYEGVTVTTAECLGWGNWSLGWNGPCLPRPCYNLTSNNSDTTDFAGVFKDKRTVTCTPGYVVKSSCASSCQLSYDSECLHTGLWSKNDTCERRPCPTTSLISANVTTLSGVYEDNVTIVCNTGWKVLGKQEPYTTTCRMNGQWSPFAQCEIIVCQQLIIANTNATSSRNVSGSFGEVINISCDVGFWVKNTFSSSFLASCRQDRTWNSTTCVRKPCSLLNVTKSNVTGSPGVFEDEHHVVCDTGYSARNSMCTQNGNKMSCERNFTAKCLSTQQWDKPEPCELSPCIPLTIANSQFATPLNNQPYQSVVAGNCLTGYEVSFGVDSFSITCQADGSWSNTIVCYPKACANLTVADSDIVNKTGVFKNNVTGQCKAGYVIPASTSVSTFTSQCQANRTWNYTTGCVRRPCPTKTIPSAQSITITGVYGAMFTINCNTGWAAFNGNTTFVTKCNETGNWSPLQDCSPVNCGNPQTPTGSSVIAATSATTFNHNTTYKCDSGYSVMEGSATINCLTNSSWSSYPICHKDCPSLSAPTNGLISTSNNSYRTAVKVTCNQGQLLVGSENILCGLNGQWNTTVPTCQAKACVPGQLSINNSDIVNKVGNVGDVFPASCNQGYVITSDNNVNTFKIHCKPDLTWNVTTNYCTRKQCASLTITSSDASGKTGHFKDTLMVKCNTGYSANNLYSFPTICQHDGSWNDSTACTIVNCGAAQTPTGVEIDVSKSTATTTYGSRKYYTCKAGYHVMEGMDNIICQANATWTAAPKCNLDCPALSAPTHGYLSTTIIIYKTVVTASCDSGFYLSNNSAICCGTNGAWNTTVPTCERKACSAITLPNSDVNGKTGVFENKVTGNCSSGYVITTDNNVRTFNFVCQANQTWNVSVDTCTRKKCVPLSVTSSNTTGIVGFYGDTATILCNVGHYANSKGSYPTQCKADGSWNDTTVCTIISCGAAPIPTGVEMDSTRSNSTLTYGSKTYYNCKAGYHVMERADNIKCQANGSWTAAPICNVDCPTLAAPTHGSLSTMTVIYKTVVTASCNSGFYLSSIPPMLCGKNGVWNTTVPTCERKACSAITIQNSDINGKTGVFENKVTGNCSSGYVITPDNNVQTFQFVCQANQTWNVSTNYCTRKQCSTQSIPSSNTTGMTGYYTDISTVLCDIGHYSNNRSSYRLQCKADGLWNDTTPCIIVSCGSPPTKTGIIIDSTKSDTTQTYLSNVTYKCDSSYDLIQKVTKVTCQADGVWSTLPFCYKNCPVLPAPQNGTLSTTAVAYNTSVAVGCHYGYKHINYSVISCNDTGTWNGTLQDCKKILCGPAPSIENGNAIMPYNDTLDSVASYQCLNESYVLFGDQNITCQFSEQWTAKPNCTYVDCGEPPDVKFGKYNMTTTYAHSTATYYCLFGSGEVSIGSPIVTCLTNGSWTKEPICFEDCPALNVSDYKYVSSHQLVYMSQVTVTCEDGYSPPGRHIHRCAEGGKWNPPLTFCYREGTWLPWSPWTYCSKTCNGPGVTQRTRVCIPPLKGGKPCKGYSQEVRTCDLGTCLSVSCPDMPEISRATPNITTYRPGTPVEYKCEENYMFGNGRPTAVVWCSQTATWEIPDYAKVCQKTQCSALSPRPLVHISSDKRAWDTEVMIWCEGGHIFHDDTRIRILVCLKDGTWTSLVPECKPVQCPLPQIGDNIVGNFSSLEFGKPLTYECQEGTRAPTGQEWHDVACSAHGYPIPSFIHCKRNYCRPPLHIENSYLWLEEKSGGLLAHYECLPLHKFPKGHTKLTVNCINGRWDLDEVPICLVPTCPPVPTSFMSNASTDITKQGTIVDYRCDYGYHFPGFSYNHQISVECLANLSWSRQPPDCAETYCPTPVKPKNSMTSGSFSSPQRVDTLIIHNCVSGRFIDGTKRWNTTCIEDATWSGTFSDCLPGRCPPFQAPKHSTANSTIAIEGTEVTVSCILGHAFPSEQEQEVVTCGQDLKWHGSSGDCDLWNCKAPPPMRNSRVSYVSTLYQSTVTYSCTTGYKLSKGAYRLKAQCNEHGKWIMSPPNVTCEIVRCPPVPFVAAAEYDPTETQYGTKVIYACKKGFWVKRGLKVTATECLANGQWSNRPPNCTVIKCPHIPAWSGMMCNDSSVVLDTGINCTCPQGYSYPKPLTTLITKCQLHGNWTPILQHCSALPKPPADTTEAPGAQSIGTMVIILLAVFFGAVIVLDFVTYIPVMKYLLAKNFGVKLTTSYKPPPKVTKASPQRPPNGR